jgi:hypothetical protein
MAVFQCTQCTKCGRWLEPEEKSGVPCPRCGSLERKDFDQESAVVDDKAAVAKELAKRHFQAEAGLQTIIRLTGSAEVEVRHAEPIKLLEVNTNAIPSGVLPISFGPAPASGITYPSTIVEVSPEEFAKIKTQELKLPHGWILGEELPKPSEDPVGK